MKFRLFETTLRLGEKKGEKRVIAKPVTVGKMTFDKFCREVADGSTVDTADVKAVIDRMHTVLKRRIEEGYAVDCGELGNFRPSFTCKLAESFEDFDPRKHIQKPRIIFYPRADFRDLEGVKYERIEADAPKRKADAKPETNEPADDTHGNGNSGL